ncbi:hypothetical protein NE237_006877 [Protea cynaroides]|uniref:Cationic amino acid transporter n=1 Tax=Protea cynaroides TaxID=273540 RepID=A0A9Q0KNA0_9MAGN|nr:hypothetical protein NE237_006877 [Protea cynaroides]
MQRERKGGRRGGFKLSSSSEKLGFCFINFLWIYLKFLKKIERTTHGSQSSDEHLVSVIVWFVLTRSLEIIEMTEVKTQSEHEMKKNLSWWDLIWLGIGSVIGAGIFVLTGLEANFVAGPAVVLSYVVSGISAMLSVLCYTEFTVEIPVASNISLLA